MQDTTLSLPNNLAHNVLGPREGSQTTLLGLANLYLETEVDKGAAATFDAKQRDLQRFLTYYHALYGHDRPEEWFVSVSKGVYQASQPGRTGAGLGGAHLCHGAALCTLAAPEV